MASASELQLTHKNPPIVELALSILFEPNEKLNDVHLGPFWWDNRADFPSVEPMQPIRMELETFASGSSFSGPALTVQLMNEPETRLMMNSEDRSWLCQLQRDRMVVNWRKLNSEYPRYPAVKSKLQTMWDKWSDFATKVGGSAPVPTKWELVYVNKLSLTTKQSLGWEKVLPGLFHSELKEPSGGRLVGRRCQWIWDIDTLNTRLVVDSAPATQEPLDSIILSFTARGVKQPSKDIWQALDDGHTLARTYFDKVVSNEILLQCDANP